MSEGFKSIEQGLTEAIEYSQGKPGKVIVHEFTPIDVKAIREKVSMKPRGPALVLLNVVAKEPEAVLRALSKNSESIPIDLNTQTRRVG